MAMARRVRDIAEGQHYRKAGPAGGIWEVVAVRTDASGAVHAKMRSVEDNRTYRTFAIGALADTRNFQFVKD
jgi:hypothetical protein